MDDAQQVSDLARWSASPPPPSVSARPRGREWDLLLVCVAVYIAAAVGRVHQLFPVLLVLRPALVSAILAIGLYLLSQSGQRRVGLLRSSPTICLVGLLVWGALAIPGALNQGVAFGTWSNFAATLAMCFVIAGSVRRGADVERLALVYFGVTALYTVVVLLRFQLQLESDDWRLGRLYYYDANDFATLIVSAMPLGLYFVLGQRRRLARALAAVGLSVLAVGLIRSGSRGGFIAFVAVTAFILLGFTTIRARSRLVGLIVLLAVVVGAASDRYWAQMQTLLNPNQDYNLTSDAGRMRVWRRGLGYMTDNPVVGVGMGNFPAAEGTISPMARLAERGIGVRWGAAHNSFIQVGAELGIPGLLLFVGLVASVFRSLHRVGRRRFAEDPSTRGVSRLAQSLMAALVGFIVGAFFLSLAYADMLYTLVAMAIALQKVTRGENSGSRRVPRWARR